ncbi:u box domain-containing partial [Plasmopara halstedii]|uniref:U box domain-containing partial n=1 Tax=Plasmopara halstedii TaxID=4781 RepID=A0A0P1B608_PLAHL|nr:u box domain-containing partial [Plasmopara halstedii]CEG50262.1 u box domain-containing partial [Plasmopara halstedii]
MASCSSSSNTIQTFSSMTQASAGVLSVDILGARNLPPAVFGSLLKWTPNYANPYVVLSLNRDHFVSSMKFHDLNPNWKESGKFHVPLPSESEILETFDSQNAHVVGKFHKMIENVVTHSKSVTNSHSFHPCAPELYVQVYHSDEIQVPRVASSHVYIQGHNEKLLGSVNVPVLPCLLSSTSSTRKWYQLIDEDGQNAGQLHLVLNFDVSAASNGLEPEKGDIVRLTGFGGFEYYAKIIPPNARMVVLEVFQDQIFVETQSQEGWLLRFEIHRNLLHVERRPSLLHDTSEQLQHQVRRVQQLNVVTNVQRVWLAVPDTPRTQVENSAAFIAFFGIQAYLTLEHSVKDVLHRGISSGVQTLIRSSKDAFGQVKHEFIRVYWSTPRRITNDGGYDDDLVDCGPRMNRGHIVRAFTAASVNSEDTEDEMMVQWETFNDSNHDELIEKNIEVAVPEQLICPITGCPMVDPVVAADGHSYEREAITHWLKTSDISPMTGMHMITKQVFPNFTLRQLSEEVQATATRRQQVKRYQRDAKMEEAD